MTCEAVMSNVLFIVSQPILLCIEAALYIMEVRLQVDSKEHPVRRNKKSRGIVTYGDR